MNDVKSVKDIRDQLDTILERARSDEAFGEELNRDPKGVLRGAGLHSAAVNEVSKEIEQFAGGEGSRKSFEAARKPSANRYCDYTTCWISWCDHWGTFRTS